MKSVQEVHYQLSRLRHSRVLQRQEWLWKTLGPPFHALASRLYRRPGVWTYINGDAFKLDAAFGSPFGWRSPRAYEPILYTAFIDAIRPGMHVLDVGAHIGIFTLAAARRIGLGKVYAFEPLPEAFAALERHTRLNNCGHRVTAIEAAVSDVDGRVCFYASAVDTMASLGKANVMIPGLSTIDHPIREVNVESVTVDTFCKRMNIVPDVMKVDVEGAELRVLRGARSLLSNTAPVVFCEVHPTQLRNCGSSLAELRSFLADIDYTLEPLDDPSESGIFHGRVVRRRVAGNRT